MGLPELIIGGIVGGGLLKADNQQKAGAYQANALNQQGQAATVKAQQDAAAVEASAAPALATARAADFNAKIAGDNAAATLQAGAEEEARYRLDASNTLASGRAAAAASGVEVSGSALDVLADNASKAELNALTIRHKSVVQANAYLNAQTLDQFQAAQAAAQAQYVGQQAAYIRTTAPGTAAQYAAAARAAAQQGQNASTSTLLDTLTKGLSSGVGQNALGSLFGSGGDTAASSMGPGEGASLGGTGETTTADSGASSGVDDVGSYWGEMT